MNRRDQKEVLAIVQALCPNGTADDYLATLQESLQADEVLFAECSSPRDGAYHLRGIQQMRRILADPLLPALLLQIEDERIFAVEA